MKLRRVILFFLAMAFSLAACIEDGTSGETENDEGEASGSSGEDTIQIGAVLPMTGPAAVFGEKFEQAYSLAVEEINEAGGIQGKDIEVVIADSQEIPSEGVTVTENLINNDDILVLTGGRSSGVTLAVGRTAAQYDMPYLIDHGTADDATMSGWDTVFRLNPTAGMYVDPLTEFLPYIDDLEGIERIAYLQVDNAFGESIWQFGLEEILNDLGYEVMHETYDDSSLDYIAILNNIKEFDPDVIIKSSGADNEAVQLIQDAAQVDINPKLFIGTGGGHAIQGYYNQAGDISNYVATVGPWHGDRSQEEWHDFYDKFTERFGHAPGEHEVEGYSAIYVLADALERAEDLTREAVTAALRDTDMETIFGPVKFEDFDGYENQNRPLVEAAQWHEGTLTPVFPLDIAEGELVFPVPEWNDR